MYLYGGGGSVTKSCPILVTPLTVAQALLSMGFPRQEYWSRLPFPSPGDLPDSGIKPKSPALLPPEVVKVEVVKVDSLLLSHQESPQ